MCLVYVPKEGLHKMGQNTEILYGPEKNFEAVIGLEVHCQLATETKIFCACVARVNESVSEIPSNKNTCPICAGHPGSLPSLNKKAVQFAIKAGLATGCRINKKSIFARKNYFYPDLPKGYQISQFDLPLCEFGKVTIAAYGSDSSTRDVSIHRIHMEEDAGKNVHLSGFSLVNLNRAGMPLIEIVSGPDMRTPEEAGQYLRELYSIIMYLDICDGNLQEGNFRCDANVSVRLKGTEKLGTRAEIKNVNSFRFVEQAIQFEIDRQIELISKGDTVVQETRLYDPGRKATFSMRTKEEAHDYRYFPDPDLLPLVIPDDFIESTRKGLPELPQARQMRYVREFGLSAYDAGVLTASKSSAVYFEEVMQLVLTGEQNSKPDRIGKSEPVAAAKCTSNLIAGEIAYLLKESPSTGLNEIKIRPNHVADIVKMILIGELSASAAKQVLAVLFEKGGNTLSIVDSLGLRQVNDTASLEVIVDKIILSNPTQVLEYKSGKVKLLGYLVGQAMKEAKGKANPTVLQEIMTRKLV